MHSSSFLRAYVPCDKEHVWFVASALILITKVFISFCFTSKSSLITAFSFAGELIEIIGNLLLKFKMSMYHPFIPGKDLVYRTRAFSFSSLSLGY